MQGPVPTVTHFMQGPVPTVTDFMPARLQPINGVHREIADYDWMTLILLAGFLLLAFVKYNFSKRIGQLIKACFVPRSVPHLYREGNPSTEQSTIVLGVIYLLSSSLFIYLILEYFGLLPYDLVKNQWLYTGILVVNTFYWLAKTIANKILAHIFKTYEVTRSYLLNNLLFNLTLGIFLLLILPLVVYTHWTPLLIIAMILTLIMIIYKVLRGILLGLSITRYPPFYLILYIITFEVAPLLLIAKFFII